MRLEGIDTMLKLASKSFLLPSVQYAMLCGWQRLIPEGTNIGYVCAATPPSPCGCVLGSNLVELLMFNLHSPKYLVPVLVSGTVFWLLGLILSQFCLSCFVSLPSG